MAAVRVAAVERVARRRRRSPEGPGGLEELVDAACDGDAKAFERLVRLTYADTYDLALRLVGNEHDACDVVAGGLPAGVPVDRRFRGEACCSHLALPDHRQLRLDPARAPSPDGRTRARRGRGRRRTPGGRGDPELVLDGMTERSRVVAALDALPDALRAVVVLRDIYDLPHRDDRRRARHLADRRQGAPPPGAQLLREQLLAPPKTRAAEPLRGWDEAVNGPQAMRRPGGRAVSCEEVAGIACRAIMDGSERSQRRPGRHVEQCRALPGRARPLPEAAALLQQLRCRASRAAGRSLEDVLAAVETEAKRTGVPIGVDRQAARLRCGHRRGDRAQGRSSSSSAGLARRRRRRGPAE